jgi:dihydrofolate synthase/folylpolyglutamate synthase
MRLPMPALTAPVQLANAAAAIAALHAPCADGIPIIPLAPLTDAAAVGLRSVRVPARLQVLGSAPELVVDVGHNPQAARALAEWLDAQPHRTTHAVYGALADKDVAGVIAALGARIDHWHLAGLEQDTPRGLAAPALAAILNDVLPAARFDLGDSVSAALCSARAVAGADQRILAFGSFFVASAVLGNGSSTAG